MILMTDQLDYIHKITDFLGSLGPPPDGFYLKCTLMEEDEHTVQGEWSDEISHGCWYFDTEPKNKGEKQ